MKRYPPRSVHSSIIYSSQDMEAIQVPINRRMDKDVVCVCVCVCTDEWIKMVWVCVCVQWNTTWLLKNECLFAICSSVDGLGGDYAK